MSDFNVILYFITRQVNNFSRLRLVMTLNQGLQIPILFIDDSSELGISNNHTIRRFYVTGGF